MTQSFNTNLKRRPRRSALSVVLIVAVLAGGLSLPAGANTTSSYNFDTAGDLAELFHGVGTGVASVTQVQTGGVNNTGSIAVPLSSVNAVFTTKESYSLGPIGSRYRFSTYIKSEGNSGYSGVGFTTSSPAIAKSVTAYRPDNAFGISVHGGGFIFHNGDTNYSGSWGSTSNAGIDTIQQSLCHDLINNQTACGSPDKWFRIFFTVERITDTTFDLEVEVWPSNADGTLRFDAPTAAFAKRGISNTTIQNAPQLFSYFSFSGTRVTRFDEYQVELSGGATVVAENAPVVLTQSVNVVGEPTVEMSGRVLSEGSSPVIERGFVYTTSAGLAPSSVSLASAPTVNDTKVVVGDGAGDFSASTSLVASGTYVFRAYATNSSGTSYGSEQTVVYVANQPAPAPAPAPDPAPAPASEPAVNVPQLPNSQPAFGAPMAVIGGQPISTLITPSPVTNPFTTDGSMSPLGFTIGTISPFGFPISVFLSPFGNMDPFSNSVIGVVGSSLVIGPFGTIEADLSGFRPFSPVEIWMFSTPTRLAQVITDADGAYHDLFVPLSGIAPGRHTLSIRGTLASGETAELTARVWVVPSELAFSDIDILSVHGPAIAHLATVDAARGHMSGQFKQGSALTRGQAATILTNLFKLESAPNPFRDADRSIHAAGIGSLAALGVISGFDDGSYRPDQILTRGQAAMLLQRLLALDESKSTFIDAAGSFSSGAIGALESVGLVSGVTTDSFAPELPVQRGQFATMAVNALYHSEQAG